MPLPENIRDWPDRFRDEFEERAAILEHDCFLLRQDADVIAEREIRIKMDF